VAYRTKPNGPRIEIGSPERKWMNDTKFQFANRCLPLRIANQAGWVILNDRKIEAVWNGGGSVEDVAIQHHKNSILEDISRDEVSVVSHFGHGIVTWRIPYLFRTPPGYNLYVRGPSNWCKDGACALDAVVETDWAVATFTMNWKITRAKTTITFNRGEPICMIFLYPRGMFERIVPEIRQLSSDPETERKYMEWRESRKVFNRKHSWVRGKPGWQKHYYIGNSPRSKPFPDHQLRLDLRTFEEHLTGATDGTYR